MTTGNGQMHAESSGKPRCHIRQASVHACSEGVLPLLHACSIVYSTSLNPLPRPVDYSASVFLFHVYDEPARCR